MSIRRATNLNNLYYVKTNENPSDCGTRPDKVSVNDVLTGSKWHSGTGWMADSFDRAIANGILKPALQLRLNEEEQLDYEEGLIIDKVPELLIKGHVINEHRVTEIEKRARFSNYLILPTKWGFKKFIRVITMVFKFLLKCKKGKPFTGHLLAVPLNKVPALLTVMTGQTTQSSEPLQFSNLQLEDKAFAVSVTYLFRIASLEVKQFNKKNLIEKHGTLEEGIIFAKSRLLDHMEFNKVTGMEMVSLDPLGINVKVPLLDRFSPLSYSLAQYVHWEVSKHSGLESCNRLCLERVHILQGFSLFKEIAKECIVCKIKRGKFLEASIGPVGDHQLTIAPPMYACQADIFGPISVFVPGFSAKAGLRGRPADQVKVWVLTFVCPVTRLVSCQVIETDDSNGVISAVIRLGADFGWPRYLMIDKDSAIMKALSTAEITLRDLQHNLYVEHGVIFSTCPVGGHYQHGHVERTIKSIQESLDKSGLKNARLTATGLQTLLKLVENNYNSLPLGYSLDRSLDNSPLYKIITPNFFKFGRNNQRALDGPVRLPTDGGEILQKVYDMYQLFFKLWADTYVPKLIYRPSSWTNDGEELKIGDLVYFQKSPDKKIGSKWIIGMVEQLPEGRDGKPRRVLIKYQNAAETQPRITDRAIRSLVKIHDVDDYVLQEDLGEMLNRLIGGDLESSVRSDVGYPKELHQHQVHSENSNTLHPNPLYISGLWLQRPVCDESESQSKLTREQFKMLWADRCQMTYTECSLLAVTTASLLCEHVGTVMDTLMPSIKLITDTVVNTEEDAVSDRTGINLIDMLRKINFVET